MTAKKDKDKISIETTKEVVEAKKKASRGKGRGVSFRPYVEDLKTRLAKVEEKRARILKMGSEKLLAKQKERRRPDV